MSTAAQLTTEQALAKLHQISPILEKHLGEDVFVTEETKPMERVPTGLEVVDYILGGGIGRGTVIEVFGPESTGKSTFFGCVIAATQKTEKMRWLYLDYEYTVYLDYFQALGVDIKRPNFILAQPKTMEEGALIAKLLLQQDIVDGVVWDTLGASKPAVEVNQTITEKELREGVKEIDAANTKTGRIGLHSQVTAMIIGTLRPIIAEKNAILGLPNQTRTTINTWGAGETTPGGQSPKFHCSYRIRLSKAETTKESVADDFFGTKQATAVENVVQFHVVKNKTAAPFRKATVRLAYGRGFLDKETLLDLGVKRKVIKKAGGGNFELPGGVKIRGTQQVIDHWTANPADYDKFKMELRNAPESPDEYDTDLEDAEDLPEGKVAL